MFLTFSEFFNISRFEGEILARFKAAVTTFNCNPKTKTCKLCKKDTGTLFSVTLLRVVFLAYGSKFSLIWNLGSLLGLSQVPVFIQGPLVVLDYRQSNTVAGLEVHSTTPVTLIRNNLQSNLKIRGSSPGKISRKEFTRKKLNRGKYIRGIH